MNEHTDPAALPNVVRPADQHKITGISKATAWAYARNPDNDFPSPRKFGPNVSGWLRDELIEWVNNRPAIYSKQRTA